MEIGGALFEEGANAFLAILRMKTLELVLDFPFEGFDKSVLIAPEEGLLHGADSDLRADGNFMGQGAGFGFELIGRDNVIDDAEAMGGFRVDHVAEVEQLRGDGWADELG